MNKYKNFKSQKHLPLTPQASTLQDPTERRSVSQKKQYLDFVNLDKTKIKRIFEFKTIQYKLQDHANKMNTLNIINGKVETKRNELIGFQKTLSDLNHYDVPKIHYQ